MKLNYKRTILIGFAFMSICAFWQFYDNEIPKILTYHFGLGETLTGTIMAFDNVLALFLLPMFGTLSDKANTRLGKRMPFILIGTVLSVILFLSLIYIAHVSTNLQLFIFILLLLLVAMGIYRSPAVSLMPELTPAVHRSGANAIINLMGTLGAVYTLIMIKVFLKSAAVEAETNYTPLAIAIAAFMVITVAILFFTIPEKKLMSEVREGVENFDGDDVRELTGKDEDEAYQNAGKLSQDVFRSLTLLLCSVFLWFTAYNAVTTAFSRYVTEVWGLRNGAYADCLMIAMIAAVLSYIPVGFVSAKLGRKKTILIGITLMSICYLSAALMPQYNASLNFLFAIIGIGWAAINVNSYPMVVGMGESRVIGKYTGLYYTFSMAAQVFTPIFSGFLLEHVSYRTLFPYAFVFSCLSFITMLFVKHGDVKPTAKKNVLEHFDVDN
ncbi:MFS transporter [Butyrivibrio sp. INlla16]|uniref:MFS transporter n=1 Tax=Butyrivibrio sp. INlla16 TaxID=1520807 RepID=UPI00087DF4DA|nr:MFS transporter [Butyrivibrio sp. INlla16]SDB26827.1 Na+/melibiose symporter [Butyrivibrio sp. INlla16]